MPRALSILGVFCWILLLFSPAVFADDEEHVFRELLKTIPEESLHAALHNYGGKYKHGVFPADRTAIEAVHRERAADASLLVQMAKRAVNATTSAAPTTTPAESSTTPTTTLPGQSPTTTTGPESSVKPTDEPKKPVTSFTSTIIRTSTGSDGQPSTVTETTLVAATPSEPSKTKKGGKASSTGDGATSLQTDTAAGLYVRRAEIAVAAAVVIFGVHML